MRRLALLLAVLAACRATAAEPDRCAREDGQPVVYALGCTVPEPADLRIVPAPFAQPAQLRPEDEPLRVRWTESRERRWWRAASWSFAAASAWDLGTTWDAMGRGRREVGYMGLLDGKSRETVMVVGAAGALGLWTLVYWLRAIGSPAWATQSLIWLFTAVRLGAGAHNLTAR
jgi:hypothetical protein